MFADRTGPDAFERTLPQVVPDSAPGSFTRDEELDAAVGWTGEGHRRFLSDFYSGGFPGSWTRGLVFQENETTGDRRISGAAASLAGLEAGDGLAIDRLLLGHLAVLGFGGLPLIWMGDELALRNDSAWAEVEEHAGTTAGCTARICRVDVAGRRHVEGTLEQRVWSTLRRAAAVRASLPAMHASVEAGLLTRSTRRCWPGCAAHPRRRWSRCTTSRPSRSRSRGRGRGMRCRCRTR